MIRLFYDYYFLKGKFFPLLLQGVGGVMKNVTF